MLGLASEVEKCFVLSTCKYTGSKINNLSMLPCQVFSDSDALDPHWWLPGENLHFKSFTDAIASANIWSDSEH